MEDFINNLIPYVTDITPYYIGITILMCFIGMIIAAKTAPSQGDFMFVGLFCILFSVMWPAFILGLIVTGFLHLLWRIFGDKS